MVLIGAVKQQKKTFKRLVLWAELCLACQPHSRERRWLDPDPKQCYSQFGDALFFQGTALYFPRCSWDQTITQWAWKTIKRRWGECQQCFHCSNPQIKVPSQGSTSLYGQKHIENPIPERTMRHDVPVPKLAPVPCSAVGHTNPRVSVPSGHADAHHRVTHSSQLPLLKSMTGKSPASPNERRPPCQGHTDSSRQHLPQSTSETDERRAGKGAELPSLTQELGAGTGFKLKTYALLTACPLEQTTIKTTAHKYTPVGALTSTNSCLHRLTW